MEAAKSWPRNGWYLAAWASEVGEQPLSRTILNEPIVLFRDANGKIGALEDRCCHRAAPLSMGAVVPGGLQCKYHGMVFAADGTCVSIPGQRSIPPQARVVSYPLVQRQEFIWIWMGDPKRANRDEIVDFPPAGSRAGSHQHGMMSIKCNYM